MSENIQRLEEKIAFLERHVSEQDKAMLAFSDELGRLRREIKALRDRAAPSAPRGGEDDPDRDERPPHY